MQRSDPDVAGALWQLGFSLKQVVPVDDQMPDAIQALLQTVADSLGEQAMMPCGELRETSAKETQPCAPLSGPIMDKLGK